jgi:putative membrane protein
MRHLLLISAMAISLPLAAMAQTTTNGMGGHNNSTGTGNAPQGENATAKTSNGAADNGNAVTANSAASNMSASPRNQTAQVSSQDKRFVKQAAEAGKSEVQEGKLAEQKGDDTVKSVGTRMVTDHTRANDQLRTLAQTQGVHVPNSVDSTKTKQLHKLQGMSKLKFDHQYLADQKRAHEKAIKLFTKEAHSGSDPELKSFAASNIPMLRNHLRIIRSAIKKES